MLRLFHRDFGGEGKPPLVILHGLLGSSRNWQTAGAELAATHHVRAVDLRNHGFSPHAGDHDYATMEADLVRWLDEKALGRVTLVGHSMGGKLAMAFACHHPARTTALVVVDIAPRRYAFDRFEPNFDAMEAVDLATLTSRADAERQLGAHLSDWGMMKFLATNLERDADGRFFWRVNVATLRRELAEVAGPSLAPGDRFAGPVLFIAGERSYHIRDDDHAEIRDRFPQAQIETIAGAGHNPHLEARAECVAVLRRFLALAGK